MQYTAFEMQDMLDFMLDVVTVNSFQNGGLTAIWTKVGTHFVVTMLAVHIIRQRI
jgi:hypothetical protein